MNSNVSIFDFLLKLSIAIEDKTLSNAQHINKSDFFNILYNTVGEIGVLQDIVQILNYKFHFIRDDHDVSWEEMKFYLYNMLILEEFWENISTYSMVRWNMVVLELNKNIGLMSI